VAAAPNSDCCAGWAAKVEVFPKAGAAGLPNADWPNGVVVVVPLNPPKLVAAGVAPKLGFAPPNILLAAAAQITNIY